MATAKKKTTKKKTTQKPARGPTAYQPTQAQREVVSGMIAAGVAVDVARKLIRNPKTNRPLARATFWRAFKAEIEFGGKAITGKAVATLVKAMDAVTKDGEISTVAERAAEFWLKTREHELFSERHINENIDKTAADEFSKITPEQAERIASNVLQAAKDNRRARETRDTPNIDDEPAGNA